MQTDPFDFSGRTIIITGASRGLGRSMALAFARHGANLVLSSRKADACAEVATEVEAIGASAIVVSCHVGRWGELATPVDAAIRAFGRIDTLVNNAGIAPVAESSLATSEDLFDKTIAVNLKGPFRLAALARPHLAVTRGSIINITSIGAERPDPSYPVYAAAKGALNIVTRSQAMEFGPGVRVNAIMAGPFRTDIARRWADAYDADAPSALRRIGEADEIVTTALYLASPASTYVTGTIVRVDGGVIL